MKSNKTTRIHCVNRVWKTPSKYQRLAGITWLLLFLSVISSLLPNVWRDPRPILPKVPTDEIYYWWNTLKYFLTIWWSFSIANSFSVLTSNSFSSEDTLASATIRIESYNIPCFEDDMSAKKKKQIVSWYRFKCWMFQKTSWFDMNFILKYQIQKH